MKRFACVIGLVIVALLLYGKMNSILSVKVSDAESIHVLREMPKDSLDVIFVGSSHVGMNIDNQQIWEEYGISSMNVWAGMQPIWNSYYYVKEVLRQQRPKVICVDVFLCANEVDYSTQEVALKNVLGLPMGWDKVQAALASFPQWNQAVEALWGMPFYHARYQELTEADFSPDYSSRIFAPTPALVVDTNYRPIQVPQTMETMPLTEKNETYLRKIIDLCRAKNVELVLLCSPYQADTKEAMRVNQIEAIAQEQGVFMLNYMKNYREIGIDPETDFYDEGHFSITGIRKYSSALGKQLKSRYDLPDRRKMESFIWNRRAASEENVQGSIYAMPTKFQGDGVSRYIDTGVKLYENRYSDWTLITRINLDTQVNNVYLSCFNEEGGSDYRGLLIKKSAEDTLTISIGANQGYAYYMPGETEATVALVKKGEKYDIYLNGERKTANQLQSCNSYGGNLLVGCQELSPNGEKFRYSNVRVLNLEVYDHVLEDGQISSWQPVSLPEMPLPLGAGETCEIAYTLESQFIGDSTIYDQDLYLDSNLRLLDEAGTRFTLLASITPQHIDGDKVFFSCFSEEAERYRGLLVRQWNDETLNVVFGSNYGVNIPIMLGQPVKLAIIKDGSIYTVYADGKKVIDRVESYADAYDGTLLIGAQRDAAGNVFRVSRTRVNSLTVMSGVMDEADILSYSFAYAPEPARMTPSSVNYRMQRAFAGNGRDNALDTGVMLYDVPAKDWTLQATVHTKESGDVGVYFSCFSEDGQYRGLMLRQEHEDSVTLYMGELVSHEFRLTEQNRTMNLVVVKRGDTYRLYANGEFCAEMVSPCTRYMGTLLVGCQADAAGELFRFSKAKVDALEVRDGAMSEEEALKLSAQQGAGSRFN